MRSLTDMTHYFSEEPGGPERRRTITVDLAAGWSN